MPDLNAMLQQLQQLRANQGAQGGAGGVGAGGLGGLGGAGGLNPNLMNLLAGMNNQPADNRPPAERYATQLQQMADMGFTNQELNIQMLQQTGGNVQLAIERLLNMLG